MITVIEAITIDEMLKKQEAQIATLTADNERLRETVQGLNAIIAKWVSHEAEAAQAMWPSLTAPTTPAVADPAQSPPTPPA